MLGYSACSLLLPTLTVMIQLKLKFLLTNQFNRLWDSYFVDSLTFFNKEGGTLHVSTESFHTAHYFDFPVKLQMLTIFITVVLVTTIPLKQHLLKFYRLTEG